MKKLFKRAARIFRLAAYDFKSAYAGSKLGALWSVSEPLVTTAVYWFVYTVAFGGNDVCGIPYYLWLSVGIAPWFFVSNGLRTVSGAFRDYSFLVKKVMFDTSVLPAVRTISSLISHLVFMVIVTVVCLAEGVSLLNFAYLLPVIIFTTIFIYAAGRIFALVCAKYKDIQNALAVILNISFWLTPVFWSVDSLSGKLVKIIQLNPAAIIIDGYRNAILHGEAMDLNALIYLSAICIALLLIGHIYQKKALPNISDKL